MLLRKIFACTTAVLLLSSAAASAADAPAATAAPAQKCPAIAPKNYPATAPAAAAKQGRFAGCVKAGSCKDSSSDTLAALGKSFCMMNNYQTCFTGTVDKPTLVCRPEFRAEASKGLKLSNCVSRPSKIACPKDGEEICLCDLEVEAKGAVQCGCAPTIAPTPTPAAH